ncbi:glycosyltransferase [Laribacter hongkongensis]|uniref:glycosyltransferase n=1 Tax=Laribacter hongkongensis TaxID=168471 RepID=UPI001878BCE7|nr:glycosyltransferase [Laribacter hongkongensis]
MKLTVVVTTYNRPTALNLVIQGFTQQKNIENSEWELIVADDGSGIETKNLIDDWKRKSSISIKHVWHEDKGFRAAKIRNLASQTSAAEYLVFIDGDCIPMNDFCIQHLRLAEPGWMVAGTRILASEKFTKELLNNILPLPYQWSPLDWFTHRFKNNINSSLGWLRTSPNALRHIAPKNWKRLRGCNFGIHKKDFEKTGCFNEEFEGWGYEDSEFAIRGISRGIYIKDGRLIAPLLHLWHSENDRSLEKHNKSKLEELIKKNEKYL